MSCFLVLSFLAGCVGTSTSDEVSTTLGVSEGESGIRGLVISDELFPVPDANIAIGEQVLATTDAAGRFEIAGLAPGVVVLNVTATGYEAAEYTVDVPIEGFSDIQIPMKGLPGQSPYKLTYIYDGFMACSYSTPYSAGPLPSGSVPCPFGERKSGTRYDVGAEWRGGVHEMAWKTQEEMIFSSSLVPRCLAGATTSDPCPALIWGKSPLRVIARPMEPEYAKKYAIDGKAMWPEGNHTSHIFGSYSGYARTEFNQTFNPVCVQINRQFRVPEHWGCPFGFGYAVGIRFQFYHTTFYREVPPDLEQFSALPSG